jgi:hypothetical protein
MAYIDPATLPVTHGPMTAEAFVADRQQFWTGFTRFMIYGAAVVIAILILMAIFLV